MLRALREFVVRLLLKDSPKGVMTTLPNKDLVDMNVQMTAEFLMRNGVDPNSLKNANQVENAINMIENKPKVQQGITSTKSAKVFDLEGKEIDPKKGIMGGKQIPDDDLPPPGSRGGPDDIAAPVQSAEESLRDMTEAEIKKRLEKQNKEAAKRFKDKMKDDPEDMATGGRAGFKEGEGIMMAGSLGDEKDDISREIFGKPVKDLNPDELQELMEELERLREKFRAAQGGRAGFKDGMTRRTFLKILGGAMSIPIIGKFLKPMKVGKTVTKVPMIKTDDVAGKPEWFDALVNKVIMEGDDVTKRFSTGERQIIHQKDLGDGTTVRVTQDTDQGAVRVEYESEQNVFGDPVQMEYKKPLPDEGDPRPSAEFTTAESGPVGRQSGPDDYDIEIDEVGGSSIRDLDSDVSKLKEYATGKGPTMREIIQNKKRRDKAQRITDDPEAQTDAVIARQGEMLDVDPELDFASGGIARLLGE